MGNIVVIIFWLSTATVVYAYLLFPVLVWLLSQLFGSNPEQPEVRDGEWPTVTLLIAAHNEEAVIEERIRNALRTDYPLDRLTIVIASDGSSDNTVAIAEAFQGNDVVVHDGQPRVGKSATLNAVIPRLQSDVVILSDANTHFEPDAVRQLAKWFACEDVDVVCGKLVVTDPITGNNADSLYWRYETFLKLCDAKLGGLLGSNGAIYAIRQKQFVQIPAETIVDDFVIPLRIKQQTGCRIIYESSAIAFEESAANVRAEFRRRARIGAGGFQAIALLWQLLDPRQGWTAFTFLSHKVLRWLCPFCLIAMIACCVLLYSQPFFRIALCLQVCFYAAAWCGRYIGGRSFFVKPIRLATMFTTMNVALLVGFGRWLRGSQKAAWDRTDRTNSSQHAVLADVHSRTENAQAEVRPR